MKIAFFVMSFPKLSETFVLRQVTGLAQLGHQVDVISSGTGDDSIELPVIPGVDWSQNIRTLRPSNGGKAALLFTAIRFMIRAPFTTKGRRALGAIIQVIRQSAFGTALDILSSYSESAPLKYDAIIAHFGNAGVRAFYLREAGLFEGALATVFHGYDMSGHKTVASNLSGYRMLFVHASKLLPISNFWAERLKEWGAPSHRIETLRMGVDVQDYERPPDNRTFASPLRVLSVARLVEKKGIRYAIEAIAGSSTAIQYDIVGSGPMEQELRSLADASSGNTICFLGSKFHNEVLELLRSYDVFLLPSVTAHNGDMEGIPVVLMEAMAMGVIVIATEHSGIPELITHGVSGLLVPERDAQGIENAINLLVSGKIDLAEMRKAAAGKIRSDHDNAKLDLQLEKICREMTCLHDS